MAYIACVWPTLRGKSDLVPMVSVIIPVYNRESLLPRALRSVLVQRGFPIEIIVVDDASTDGTTAGVIKWCQESGVECRVSRDGCLESESVIHYVPLTVSQCSLLLIKLSQNSGPAVARNRGLAKATGEYVAFLDSDDEWLPGSLSARLDVLERHGDIDLVFCDMENAEEGATTLESFLHARNVWPELRFSREDDGVCIPENLFDCQLIQPLVGTPTVVIRGKLLSDRLRFDERLRVAEDWEFWLRVFRQHKVGFLDQVLVRRNLQNDNLTRNSGWLEANIMAGRIILRSYRLSFSQKLFLRRRLGDDYFDLGCFLYQQIATLKNARNRFAESIMYWPSGKSFKWLIFTIIVQFYASIGITRHRYIGKVVKIIRRLGFNGVIEKLKNNLPKYLEVKHSAVTVSHVDAQKWFERRKASYDGLISAVCPYIGADAIIFDVGANIGYFTSLLAQKVNFKGSAFLFEPIPHLAELCRETLRDVPFSYNVFDFGLSDKDGEADLFIDANGNLGWSTLVSRMTSSEMVKVWVRLKSFDTCGIDAKPSFIKIDVEGSEYLVIRGMLSSLKKWRPLPVLLVEVGWGRYHPEWKEELRIFEELKQLGYAVCDLHGQSIAPSDLRETTDVLFIPRRT